MDDVIERAYAAALSSLRQSRWLKVTDASRAAYKLNLMLGMGTVQDTVAASENGTLYFTASEPTDAINLALKGDSIAFEAVVDVADHLTKFERALPLPLQRFLIEVARNPIKRRRGRHAVTFAHRDAAIYSAAFAGVNEGLSGTRNAALFGSSEAESACAVTVRALAACGVHMSEDNVQRVWLEQTAIRNRKRLAGAS